MSKWTKNWFSNMLKIDKPIKAYGTEFWTVENFFQAMKTKDIKERCKISKISPYEAKRYCGFRNKNFKLREDWESIKVEVQSGK